MRTILERWSSTIGTLQAAVGNLADDTTGVVGDALAAAVEHLQAAADRIEAAYLHIGGTPLAHVGGKRVGPSDVPARKAAFLKAYSEGARATHAEFAAGVPKGTHYRWLREDPAYAAATDAADRQREAARAAALLAAVAPKSAEAPPPTLFAKSPDHEPDPPGPVPPPARPRGKGVHAQGPRPGHRLMLHKNGQWFACYRIDGRQRFYYFGTDRAPAERDLRAWEARWFGRRASGVVAA